MNWNLGIRSLLSVINFNTLIYRGLYLGRKQVLGLFLLASPTPRASCLTFSVRAARLFLILTEVKWGHLKVALLVSLPTLMAKLFLFDRCD